ncbi:hypothetical protein ACFQI7_09960 [Paenibacillus allorhizosphaerae]|uniref:Uncharacterized protein n=1 Tax=Paenibacillus allorhizosphaerae TaxID=2849866 RepID=A0ABM8VIX1_9BACL|nr:hypothetical protein [Paenibacillus allorhizosphaerae]CAG7644542.1 hypothetical protein PAECIP111802_03304 [Paenibacillus allorhizosphaerae]
MLSAIRSLNDEVAVMSKCVPHDWHPYYPDNPVLGQVRPKQQWIEFDLGHEYEMQTVLPFAEPELLLKRIQCARQSGIDTCCLRLDRYDADAGNSAIYKPWGQLELQVFAKYAANPEIRLEQIVSEWEKEHFPGAAHLLGLATEVVRRMLFPQKLWLANHSNLPEHDYARTHLKDGNADRLPVWTSASKDRLAEQLCDRPTKEWIRILQADDEKTRFYLDVILAYMERHASQFDRHPQWLQGMHALRSWEELYRLYKAAYFAIRLIRHDPLAITVQDVRSKIDRLEEACGTYKQQHRQIKLSGKYAWEPHPKVIQSLRMQLE